MAVLGVRQYRISDAMRAASQSCEAQIVIVEAEIWWVLAALCVQGIAMALTALSSDYDDFAILRVSGGMGVLAMTALLVGGIPVLPALCVAATGPFIALAHTLPHCRSWRLLSRGPYADLMESHGCHSFLDAKQSERGRRDGTMLAKFLCGERFQPGIPGSGQLSGDYIASTVLIEGALYDVNLQAIFGWMPREPWLAVLTDEEINAIRFAMRPAPPVAELLDARSMGEFLVHDAFGEVNLRSYIAANNPELLEGSAHLSDVADSPLQARIQKTRKARALEWAWAVVLGGAIPLVFAWAALAGNMAGGG